MNDEQRTIWNGAAGRGWVEAQELLEALFEPLEAPLFEGLPRGGAVLDVGCGTGATTLAAARRVGAATGIDISGPMLAAARARGGATFIEADAETHAFEPAVFDAVISRFGVMFFADPVAAFRNLRRAAKDAAALRFIAWRSADENPFMTTAERAAAPLLPHLPPRRPDGPGQFAFADADLVRAILDESGWMNVDLRPLDTTLRMSLEALDRYVTLLGPVGRALRDADEPTRAEVKAVVRRAFDPYVHGSEARFDAACWLVTAAG